MQNDETSHKNDGIKLGSIPRKLSVVYSMLCWAFILITAVINVKIQLRRADSGAMPCRLKSSLD